MLVVGSGLGQQRIDATEHRPGLLLDVGVGILGHLTGEVHDSPATRRAVLDDRAGALTGLDAFDCHGAKLARGSTPAPVRSSGTT